MKLKMTIGNKSLTATFEDNATARDFIALLPFTVSLEDYAGIEKTFYTKSKLSTQDAPEGIDPDLGDITYYAPWGDVAIFYKDFGYASGLVKIATIENNINLLQVTGSIDNVKFELEESNDK